MMTLINAFQTTDYSSNHLAENPLTCTPNGGGMPLNTTGSWENAGALISSGQPLCCSHTAQMSNENNEWQADIEEGFVTIDKIEFLGRKNGFEGQSDSLVMSVHTANGWEQCDYTRNPQAKEWTQQTGCKGKVADGIKLRQTFFRDYLLNCGIKVYAVVQTEGPAAADEPAAAADENDNYPDKIMALDTSESKYTAYDEFDIQFSYSIDGCDEPTPVTKKVNELVYQNGQQIPGEDQTQTDNDYVWITNPSCDGINYEWNNKAGYVRSLTATYENGLLVKFDVKGDSPYFAGRQMRVNITYNSTDFYMRQYHQILALETDDGNFTAYPEFDIAFSYTKDECHLATDFNITITADFDPNSNNMTAPWATNSHKRKFREILPGQEEGSMSSSDLFSSKLIASQGLLNCQFVSNAKHDLIYCADSTEQYIDFIVQDALTLGYLKYEQKVLEGRIQDIQILQNQDQNNEFVIYKRRATNVSKSVPEYLLTADNVTSSGAGNITITSDNTTSDSAPETIVRVSGELWTLIINEYDIIEMTFQSNFENFNLTNQILEYFDFSQNYEFHNWLNNSISNADDSTNPADNRITAQNVTTSPENNLTSLNIASNLCGQPFQNCSCQVGNSIWLGVPTELGTMDTRDGMYTSAIVISDPVYCSKSSFDDVDPAPGQDKYCWCGTKNEVTQSYAQEIFNASSLSTNNITITLRTQNSTNRTTQNCTNTTITNIRKFTESTQNSTLNRTDIMITNITNYFESTLNSTNRTDAIITNITKLAESVSNNSSNRTDILNTNITTFSRSPWFYSNITDTTIINITYFINDTQNSTNLISTNTTITNITLFSWKIRSNSRDTTITNITTVKFNSSSQNSTNTTRTTTNDTLTNLTNRRTAPLNPQNKIFVADISNYSNQTNTTTLTNTSITTIQLGGASWPSSLQNMSPTVTVPSWLSSGLQTISPPVFLEVIELFTENGTYGQNFHIDGLKLNESAQYWAEVLSHPYQSINDSFCLTFNESTVEAEDARTTQVIIQNTIMGSHNGFKRVRHTPQGSTWHSATDQLVGTDTYGSPYDDSQFWSIQFDTTDFDQFLFMSNDGSHWMVMDKDQVQKDAVADSVDPVGSGRRLAPASISTRTVTRSSVSCLPYEVNSYKEQSSPEDLWISLTEHSYILNGLLNETLTNQSIPEMMYGGNSFNSLNENHTSILRISKGMDVYIRNSQNPVVTLPPFTTSRRDIQDIVRIKNIQFVGSDVIPGIPADFTKIGFVHYLSKNDTYVSVSQPDATIISVYDAINAAYVPEEVIHTPFLEQKFIFFAISAQNTAYGPTQMGEYSVTFVNDTIRENPDSYYYDFVNHKLFFTAGESGGLFQVNVNIVFSLNSTTQEMEAEAQFAQKQFLIPPQKIIERISVFNNTLMAVSVRKGARSENGCIEIYRLDSFELVHRVDVDPNYEKNPGVNVLKLGPIGVSSENPNDYKLVYEVQDQNDDDIVVLNEVHFYDTGEVYEFPNIFSYYESQPEKSLRNKKIDFTGQSTQLIFSNDTREGNSFSTFVHCRYDELIHDEISYLRRLEHTSSEITYFMPRLAETCPLQYGVASPYVNKFQGTLCTHCKEMYEQALYNEEYYEIYDVKQDYEKFIASRLCSREVLLGIRDNQYGFLTKPLRIILFCLIFVTLLVSLVYLLRKSYKEDHLEDDEKGPVQEISQQVEQAAATSRELLDDDSDDEPSENAEWHHDANRIWRNELGVKKEDSSVEIEDFEPGKHKEEKIFAKTMPVSLEKQKTMVLRRKTVRFDNEDREEEVFEVIRTDPAKSQIIRKTTMFDDISIPDVIESAASFSD